MSIEQLVTIHNLGTKGVDKDSPPWYLPPEAWSDASNMRMYNKQALRTLGHAQVFGTPSVVPGFLMNVPATNSSFWLYASKTKIYGYDSGVHADLTRAVGGDYTASEYRDWNTGCILGGVPILNNAHDVPQYWTGLSLGSKFANLTAWPSTLRAKVIRNFGPFLVALNLVDTGVALPQAITWSSEADPGSIPASWDYTDPTVDAGRTQLTDVQGGVILDARLLGNYLVIYKQNSTHLLRFIGGQRIFSPDLLHGFGLLATRCVTSYQGGNRHFVVTPDDVITHAGSRDIQFPFEGRDKTSLFNDMDSTNYVNAFAFENPAYKEVWFVYPQSGQTYPNRAAIWNYQENTVTFRDWNGTCVDIGDYTDSTAVAWNSLSGTWDAQTFQWSTSNRRRVLFGDPALTKIYGLDTGYPFGALTTTAYLERTGLAIDGKDRQGQPKVNYESRKLCTRLWPKVRGSASVYFRVGAQETLEGTVNWNSPVLFDPAVGYIDVDPPVQGKALAVRAESTSDAAWQLESYGLEIAPIGEF